jgi:hypothetical protein
MSQKKLLHPQARTLKIYTTAHGIQIKRLYIRMQPLRLDQLVVDQQYYIRDMREFQGPWGTVQGLNPFTFDGRDEFHLTNDPALEYEW